jgi:hypothetical protein
MHSKMRVSYLVFVVFDRKNENSYIVSFLFVYVGLHDSTHKASELEICVCKSICSIHFQRTEVTFY